MTTKQEIAEKGKQQAELVVNNAFVNGLAEQLADKQRYGLMFPKDYSVSNALNSAYLMLQETFDKDKKCVLQSCSKQSIASALMDMAVQALNPMKKQCYFVAYGGKLTLMRSYQGTLAIAKRVGVKNVAAEIIYEGDEFEYHIENGVKIIHKHKQEFKNIDTDKIIGAYAIVTTENGTYTEIMNIKQLEKAWSKGYGYKKGQGVHGDFTDQMAKKTVISRACKNFVNASDDAYLMEEFEDGGNNEGVDKIAEDVTYEIETNANMVDFIEEKEEPKEKPALEDADEIPDFMKE